jgi:hypothetical protein
MALIISPDIAAKIGSSDHGRVTDKEVRECFQNFAGQYATDDRPQHRTASGKPTYWFVGETNQRRKLKIMFVIDGSDIYLKSAYPATADVESLFLRRTAGRP